MRTDRRSALLSGGFLIGSGAPRAAPTWMVQRGVGSLRLGADRGWQKTTVVFAHFFGDEFVQQGVHSQ
jgi:hypothetical protein